VELRRLLESHPEIQIVGEASHAEEAIAAIRELAPDLVFLDVQMPGATGFDMLEKLEAPVPEVIFVTAYDEHALKAFDFNALDYLLKPIDPARLAEAINRAKNELACISMPDTPRPEPTPGQKLKAEDRVFLRDGEKCWLLPVGDIVVIESQGNYSIVKFGGNSPMLPRSLTSLEERLDPNVFFRANRSQLINLKHVKSVDLWFSGGLKVTMDGEHVVELSRRQASAFREKLSL
jgi:two-component system LytT family response regulator